MRSDARKSRRCGEQAAGLACITATAWLRLRIGSTTKLLLPLLLLTLPDGLQAQFNYTINNGTITITRYTGSAGAVTIPDTINGLPVTSIGNYAFQNESTLISVTIGNGVTTLGSGAFAGCTSLTAVTIPDSVLTIGNNAFDDCTGLTRVTIGSNVISIGSSAFNNCYHLTNVTIPNSVTSIGGGAFYACTSLTVIMVESLNPFYSSVDGVLFDKSKTTLIQYPGGRPGSCAVPNSVTNIGSSAFKHCPTLTAITVDAGNTVYSSVDGVLFDKSQTTLIQYPGGRPGSYAVPNIVTNFGDNAFSGSSLTAVTVTNSITSIGAWVFDNCRFLTNITIGSRVTSIGNSAFAYSTRLTGVFFQGNAPTVAADAFNQANQATVFYLPGNTGWTSTFGGRPTMLWSPQEQFGYRIISGKVTIMAYTGSGGALLIPSTIDGRPVISIGSAAFKNCTSLTSVEIPNGVTNISPSAFNGCTSLAAITVEAGNSVYGSLDGVLFDKSQTSLVIYPRGKQGSYTIPSSVTNIGAYAFAECASLTTITIPDSVTSIGAEAFKSCPSLDNVTIGNGVANIGSDLFQSCSNLTSVTIGNNVTNIGDWAFSYCPKLTAVGFRGNAPSFGQFVLYGDTRATIYYELGTTGWDTTFEGRPTALWDSDASCGYTTNNGTITITKYIDSDGPATIPSTINGLPVTSIGDSAFRSCISLTSVEVPNSVTNIGFSAFYLCTSLTAITVNAGNSVYSSVDGVLFDKSQSTLIQYPSGKPGNYTVPTGVTSIGNEAFKSCTSLNTVTISESVSSIGISAFSLCTSLTAITVEAGNSVYSSMDGALFNKSQTALIQYPGGKAGSYAVPISVISIGGSAFRSCTNLSSLTIGSSVTSIGTDAFFGCTSLTAC